MDWSYVLTDVRISVCQVHYIHQLAQSRLLDTDKPLHDLYRVLRILDNSKVCTAVHTSLVFWHCVAVCVCAQLCM